MAAMQMQTFARETRVRREPAAQAEQLAVLPAGTAVQVLEQAGVFSRISWQDETGQVLEGYVASGFLQPLAEEGEAGVEEEKIERTESKPTREGWSDFPWPRFDRTTGWLAFGLAALLVSNLATAIVLGRGIRDLQNRSYHVTCSGHSYPAPTFTWGKLESAAVDPGYYQDGQVKAVVSYQVMEKIPSSRMVLRYKPEGDEVWQERAMQEGERPLQYVATLLMAPGGKLDYQILQRLGEETLRADLDHSLHVGNGDVIFGISNEQGGRRRLWFAQEPWPAVTDLQVERITVWVEGNSPRQFILTGPGGPYSMSANLNDLEFNAIEIRVFYRNGEERALRFEGELPDPPVIKR